ncbi:MAG: copper transporter, partial [Acidimicrobiales bacterium]
MVNFRFHLISLTAVFLALAIGVAVGATVVDRATVDALQDQLDRVERGVAKTSAENARLGAEVGRWDSFAEQSRDLSVGGRLADVPVLLVGVAGIDREPVEELQQVLAASGALVQGTVWLTSRFGLERPEDVAALAALDGTEVGIADLVRGAVLARLAGELAADVPSPLLAALRDAAFVEFAPPAGDPAGLAAVP